MTREQASKFAKDELNKHGLSEWGVRINPNADSRYLGLCSYKDKCIILNGYHIDINPEADVINTIRHEIAHALCPGHGHDIIWSDMARKVGCDNTMPCSHLSLPADIVDAIRSGADIEMTYEEQVIRTPKFKIHKLQDKCEICGKVAKEKFKTTYIEKATGDEITLITLECMHIQKKRKERGTPFEDFITFEHKDNGCEHDWDKNKCNSCGAFRLFNFQCEGARFIEGALSQYRGCGLFDDMGLGKTVQPLAYLNYHPERFPVLFVVKSGLKFQFFKEIIRWLGPSYLAQIISTAKDPVLKGMKCYIVSYDLLRRLDRQKILDAGIKTVILDECQQIKNPDSTRTQEVREIVKNVEKVIPLSGTPWKNRGSEFFVALNMLDPTRFHSYQNFLRQWVGFYYQGERMKEGGIANPKKFREFTKDILIRRERTEVMKELPLINRTMHYVEMDAAEQRTYDEATSDFVKWYNDKVIGGEEDSMFMPGEDNILAKLARMRHITGLAKIPATVEFVHDHITETGRKIVVFVHHKDVGELLHQEFTHKYPEHIVMKLTGGMSPEARYDVQERFNNTENVILVASTLAAGEGLNLQTCADCVMHERQWNPANEEQAEGRFIRIGQTATSVNGTYMTAADTVDEFMHNIVEPKRGQFHAAMNKGEAPIWNVNDVARDLADAIVNSHSKLKKAASL